MTVYVDTCRIPYGRMLMSHMVADTLEELHAMADKVGLSRRHFQSPPHSSYPHYDVCQSFKRRAIAEGAAEVSPKDLIRVARRCRESCSRWDGVASA